MSKEIANIIDRYRGIIAIAVCIILIGIATLFVANQPEKTDAVESANTKYETALIESIKASLNVYYVDMGEYPYSYDALVEHIDEGKDILIDAKEEIPDLEYTHRGDYQAYKITYTNQDGDKVTVDGNYQDDYHE